VTTCIDSSAFFAAAYSPDRRNQRAKSLLQEADRRLTTDHVVVETWLLLNSRVGRYSAERFWQAVRGGAAEVEEVTAADLEAAWAIGLAFPDQSFSIVDRTSFAVMERLGVTRALSFDDDFAVYRYGRSRDKAFEVVR
jgi:predicted nucleic acid-binding protein